VHAGAGQCISAQLLSGVSGALSSKPKCSLLCTRTNCVTAAATVADVAVDGAPDEPQFFIDVQADLAAAEAESKAAEDAERRAAAAASGAHLCPRCGKAPAQELSDPDPAHCAGGTR